MMYDWILHNGFKPVIIATKSDKIKRSQLQKQIKLIRTKLEMQPEDLLFPFSALNKDGREDILDYIEAVVEEAELH
jgi:GTP-binding protein